ncbi:MAG: PIN domain-containing protein [Chloroflexi bacterium]|nr:PIN domain-containing protein [Chloroflexota bacterium]
MVYLDTSALLAFTLTKTMEPARFQVASKLFELINQGAIKAVTSFYALHELLVIAISNTEPDWEAGSELARGALLSILNSRLLYVPIPRREDKILKARLFSALRDATDLPHAIAAHSVNCTAIVAYDDHFRAVESIIHYKTPDTVVTELKLSATAPQVT